MRQVQRSLCRALDCEGHRRCTALIAPPHRGVGRLDMPGEPRRIEQRVCLAILRQFRGDEGEERTIACKPEHQRFILVQRRRYQFGKSDGAQHACRHAAGEGIAEAGHERQSSPQGIACGGMRIVRQGIEE